MQHELIYRGILLSLFVTAFIMSLHFRRKADKERGKMTRRGDGTVFLVPQLLLTLASLGWMLTYLVAPSWVSWSQFQMVPPLRLAGAPLGVTAIGLFIWMFRHLGSNVTATAQPRPEAELVTTGPYHWVRHPMYSSSVVWILALLLLTASWFLAIAGVAGFSFLVIRCRREEANLIEKFGDEYRAYMHRTGRFFPRWRAG